MVLVPNKSSAQICIYGPDPKTQVESCSNLHLWSWSQVEFCSNLHLWSWRRVPNEVLLKFAFMVLVSSGVLLKFSINDPGPKWNLAQIFNYGSGPGV